MSRGVWRRSLVSLLAVAGVLLAGVAAAQDFRGQILGTVTDSQGGLLPGATVTVTNLGTNVTTTATTDARGQYRVPYLISGSYSVKIELSGFKSVVRKPIEVRVGDAISVDGKLDPGGLEEVVEVTASQPLLDTSSGVTGQVIDSNQIRELPLGDGTAYMLTRLAPGVADSSDLHFARPMDNGNMAGITVNGAQGGNEVTLDGAPNRVSPGATNPENNNNGVVGFSPPSEAIAEFRVQTNAFDAQAGQTAGATVNLALKSGTNKVRGSLSYFNRDDSRSETPLFSERAGAEKPTRDYSRYTATVSGPIVKNKTFFLVSFEHLLDVQPEPSTYTVPTARMRQGDFSEWLPSGVLIYDPFTATGANLQRTAFPGNIVPAGRINNVARNYVSYYPEPNQPGLEDNYFTNQLRPYDYNALLGRFDHNFDQSRKLFLTLYWNKRQEDRYNWAKGASNASGEGSINGFEVTHGYDYRSNLGGILGYTQTLSSNVVLDVRAGVSRFGEYRKPGQEFDPATMGFAAQSLAAMGGYKYLPFITFGGFSTTNANSRIASLGSQRSDWGSGFDRPFDNMSFSPTLTWVRGAHSLRGGYELRYRRWNITSAPYGAGRYFFRGNFTRANNAAAQDVLAQEFAQFLLGLPTVGTNNTVATSGSNSSQFEISAPGDYRQTSHALFLQDDWRVNRRLTLNLGVRLEIDGAMSESENRNLAGFDQLVASPIEAQARAQYAAAPLPELPASQFAVKGGLHFADGPIYNTLVKVEPRLAVSYLLNDKTVLRGGAGLFSFPYYFDAGNQTGYSQPTGVLTTNDNGLTFSTDLTNPLPSGQLIPPVGSANGLSTGLGTALGTVVPSERTSPYYTRWQAGLQRDVGKGWVVELMYVGAKGSNLPVLRPINTLPTQYQSTSRTRDAAIETSMSAQVPNPFRGLIPASTGFNGATIGRGQLLSPFPEFGAITTQEYVGSDSYHAGTIRLDKRFSNGNSLVMQYTRSRLRDRLNYLNPAQDELEDRVSPNDRPNRFTVGATYRLPFGKGRRWGSDWKGASEAILGGWQLSATYQYQTGFPYTFGHVYYDPSRDPRDLKSNIGQKTTCGIAGLDTGCPGWDLSGFYFSDAPVQRNGVVDPALQRADQRIALTGNQVRYFPSTLPDVRTHDLNLMDLGLYKNFTLPRDMRLQLRVEAINALNYTVLWNANLAPSNAAFGYVNTDRNNPRDFQIALRLSF
jgi:hypothetical protein